MSKIRAIIFDLNGVLLQSKPLSERLAEKANKSVDEILSVLKPILKEVRNPIRSGDEAWNPLRKITSMSRDELFDFYFTGESIDREMLSFANKLKSGGLMLFILSNNFKERTTYYRENFPELFELMEKSYFSWETGFVKPDPMAYRYILEENNLKGEDCLYIDDSDKNLEVAKEFGIRGIKYESREQVIGELEKILK